MDAGPFVDIFAAPEYASLNNFAEGFGFWADVKSMTGTPRSKREQWWPSAEHYFQAGKFADGALQDRIRREPEAGVAKALGRRFQPLRPDWEEVKRSRLREAVLLKLWAHGTVRETLRAIPPEARILNGNTVDAYFGTGPDGSGANVIGEELQSLRAFLERFPQWRRFPLKVAGIGEPFDPDTVYLDITGYSPQEVLAKAALVLGVAASVIQGVQLVTDGFERIPLDNFTDAEQLEFFLGQNASSVVVEAMLAGLTIVTLCDGTEDRFLAYTDVKHLCPNLESLMERLGALVPLVHRRAFKPMVTYTVNGGMEQDIAKASFHQVLASAAQGADVVITLSYIIPEALQPPLVQRPEVAALGPPKVDCRRHTYLSKEELWDRISGLLWGAALGDAAGLATEFMSKAEAVDNYPNGISPATRVLDKHRSRWKLGDWTDDTDQLVLLLDSILQGGGVLDQRAFAKSLKRWMQEGFPELGDSSGMGIGQTVRAVLEHPVYDVAPDLAAAVVWQQSGCTAAANGAIMRCAASALCYFWDEELVTYNARAGAAVTHADPRCAACCQVVASLVARCLQGVDVSSPERRRQEAIAAAMAAVPQLDGDIDELLRAVDVSADGLEALDLAGGGIGYTYKALGAACWAFVHARSFQEAVQAIAMEAGDADSNAVVAGALLGARMGFLSLPPIWLAEVPETQRHWLDSKLAACKQLMHLA